MVAFMKRRRHTPDQIIRKLREGERLLAEGGGEGLNRTGFVGGFRLWILGWSDDYEVSADQVHGASVFSGGETAGGAAGALVA